MRRLPTRMLFTKYLAIVLVLAGWLQTTTVAATEVTDLYEAKVDAAGRTAAHQRAAMATAMREVAMKVSGRSDLKDDQLSGLLKSAETLVQSYAYEGGGRGQPLKMRVSFDSAAVVAGLQAAGVPVWSSNRPKVLLWLVREDNGQRRIVSQELDAEVLDQVKSLSQKRGLPFYLPLNDVQDMQSVSAADVWAGFLDNVKLASGRYHPDIIVLAKVFKAGLLWQGDWQIVAVGGTQSQEFNGPDLASVIEPGISWVTQDIASVYATQAPAANGAVAGEPLTFKITGVRSLKDYARVLDYLKRLIVVKQVAVREVAGQTLTLAVTSDTQVDTVLQTLKAEARLIEMPTAIVADTPLPTEGAAPALPSSAPAAQASAAATEAPAIVPIAAPAPRVYEFEWHG